MKLEKVAYNMDYTVYLDIYFTLDTAKVASSSLAFTLSVINNGTMSIQSLKPVGASR